MSVVVAPEVANRTGAELGRLRDPLVIGLFLGAILGVVGVAVLVATLLRPSPAVACPPGSPCPGPPPGAPALVVGRLWKSAEVGYQLEYVPQLWELVREDGRGLELVYGGGLMTMRIEGARDLSMRDVFQRRLDDLASRPGLTLGLQVDNAPEHALFGPNVGYVDGIGGVYVGTVDGSTPSEQLSVVVMAAERGGVAAVVSVTTSESWGGGHDNPFGVADSVLNSFTWPGT